MNHLQMQRERKAKRLSEELECKRKRELLIEIITCASSSEINDLTYLVANRGDFLSLRRIIRNLASSNNERIEGYLDRLREERKDK